MTGSPWTDAPIAPPRAFFVGLDLGQARDFSAIAVAEMVGVGTGEWDEVVVNSSEVMACVRGDEYTPKPRMQRVQRTVPRFDIGHLERLPLGTTYPAVGQHTRELLNRLVTMQPTPNVALALDFTGVGRPVADMFLAAGLPCAAYPITITGGDAVSQDGNEYRVPKRDLAGVIQVLLHAGRLKIAAALPRAGTLTEEMKNFRVKISDKGHDSYGAWREGEHDDLILATALACWGGTNIGFRRLEVMG